MRHVHLHGDDDDFGVRNVYYPAKFAESFK